MNSGKTRAALTTYNVSLTAIFQHTVSSKNKKPSDIPTFSRAKYWTAPLKRAYLYPLLHINVQFSGCMLYE
jgi:hypothetical protein